MAKVGNPDGSRKILWLTNTTTVLDLDSNTISQSAILLLGLFVLKLLKTVIGSYQILKQKYQFQNQT